MTGGNALEGFLTLKSDGLMGIMAKYNGTDARIKSPLSVPDTRAIYVERLLQMFPVSVNQTGALLQSRKGQ